jgi:aryl-alcohol dehydrogenase-like predicted oxidoreductase
MGPGPYGDLGSRKHLTASLDQSLKRLGLEYVDIYYHHRPDPDTPLEETMVRCTRQYGPAGHSMSGFRPIRQHTLPGLRPSCASSALPC